MGYITEKQELINTVLSVQNGEDNAAAALYDAFHTDLYYHILKTVNDPLLAEDILQDTFIEILKTINDLKEPAAFLSWSKQIAYHRCTAYYKKRRDVLTDEKEDGSSVFDTVKEDNSEFIPDEALDKEDLKQTIHAMIASLPVEQRSALLMRYFDEMSIKEIAEIQGVTEGTVKSRLNYARKSVKQAVEGYEKKNGVKLHCIGVIPLLLWLFREYAVSNKISLTAGNASSAYKAVEIKAKPQIAAKAAESGVKAAGKSAVKKLIAGITAAAVTIGAVAAVVLLKREPKPMVWIGYGAASVTSTRRFKLSVNKMTDKSISGHLEVSYLYNTVHDTEFTGTGTVKNGDTVYELTFETPAVMSKLPKVEYEQAQLTYDKSDDVFSFNSFYEVDMERLGKDKSETLFENESWSGFGNDGFYTVTKSKNHLFKVDVDKMTETQISGNFSVSYNQKTDHSSEFTGRGYKKNGTIYYEILLDTPRTVETLIKTITIDRFWMQYDIKTKTLSIPGPGLYSVDMEKK